MSNNKYYTPEIWEFCEGFEFERFVITSEKWVKEVFKIGEENYYFISKRFVKDLQNGDIRVKRLESSDIESLGFVYELENGVIHLDNWRKDNLSISIREHCCIYRIDWANFVYSGKIRNKFHLQQILNDITQ